MTKKQSRSDRWSEAVSKALLTINEIVNNCEALELACSELRAVQEEYEEWKDNLPENLASSALGEKLEEVCNLEIEDLASSIRDICEEKQGMLEEPENLDLPRGFGRD